MAAGDITNTVGPTQIVFADFAGDFSPATVSDYRFGTPTEVQFSMAGVLNGAARESAKVDLGENFAVAYQVDAVNEFAATPVTTKVVLYKWAPSPIATAANGNPMSINGVDSDASSGTGTQDELLNAIPIIGNFVCTADKTPQIQSQPVGILAPSHRYGILVVNNESGADMHSDDVEMHVIFTPIIPNVSS